jgi:N-acetylated-alpha-linked acidic dipeptidase
LIDSHGLPGREWYQHMVYAPGLHTGYGVKTLPAIREAIEERRWDEANRYMGVVSRALNAYSARLDRAISVP